MTMGEAFNVNPDKTYRIKQYVPKVSNVDKLNDIPGLMFSTENLSFFQSLCAIVEPLQKMGVVRDDKTPQPQKSPFKIGGTSIITTSPQKLVFYKNGGTVFVKHKGKNDGVELDYSNNWVLENEDSEMTVSPASIYTLLMQLGIDFCKTLKDDHFSRLIQLKPGDKFLHSL
jgi:hypothetical protein